MYPRVLLLCALLVIVSAPMISHAVPPPPGGAPTPSTAAPTEGSTETSEDAANKGEKKPETAVKEENDPCKKAPNSVECENQLKSGKKPKCGTVTYQLPDGSSIKCAKAAPKNGSCTQDTSAKVCSQTDLGRGETYPGSADTNPTYKPPSTGEASVDPGDAFGEVDPGESYGFDPDFDPGKAIEESGSIKPGVSGTTETPEIKYASPEEFLYNGSKPSAEFVQAALKSLGPGGSFTPLSNFSSDLSSFYFPPSSGLGSVRLDPTIDYGSFGSFTAPSTFSAMPRAVPTVPVTDFQTFAPPSITYSSLAGSDFAFDPATGLWADGLGAISDTGSPFGRVVFEDPSVGTGFSFSSAAGFPEAALTGTAIDVEKGGAGALSALEGTAADYFGTAGTDLSKAFDLNSQAGITVIADTAVATEVPGTFLADPKVTLADITGAVLKGDLFEGGRLIGQGVRGLYGDLARRFEGASDLFASYLPWTQNTLTTLDGVDEFAPGTILGGFDSIGTESVNGIPGYESPLTSEFVIIDATGDIVSVTSAPTQNFPTTIDDLIAVGEARGVSGESYDPKTGTYSYDPEQEGGLVPGVSFASADEVAAPVNSEIQNPEMGGSAARKAWNDYIDASSRLAQLEASSVSDPLAVAGYERELEAARARVAALDPSRSRLSISDQYFRTAAVDFDALEQQAVEDPNTLFGTDFTPNPENAAAVRRLVDYNNAIATDQAIFSQKVKHLNALVADNELMYNMQDAIKTELARERSESFWKSALELNTLNPWGDFRHQQLEELQGAIDTNIGLIDWASGSCPECYDALYGTAADTQAEVVAQKQLLQYARDRGGSVTKWELARVTDDFGNLIGSPPSPEEYARNVWGVGVDETGVPIVPALETKRSEAGQLANYVLTGQTPADPTLAAELVAATGGAERDARRAVVDDTVPWFSKPITWLNNQAEALNEYAVQPWHYDPESGTIIEHSIGGRVLGFVGGALADEVAGVGQSVGIYGENLFGTEGAPNMTTLLSEAEASRRMIRTLPQNILVDTGEAALTAFDIAVPYVGVGPDMWRVGKSAASAIGVRIAEGPALAPPGFGWLVRGAESLAPPPISLGTLSPEVAVVSPSAFPATPGVAADYAPVVISGRSGATATVPPAPRVSAADSLMGSGGPSLSSGISPAVVKNTAPSARKISDTPAVPRAGSAPASSVSVPELGDLAGAETGPFSTSLFPRVREAWREFGAPIRMPSSAAFSPSPLQLLEGASEGLGGVVKLGQAVASDVYDLGVRAFGLAEAPSPTVLFPTPASVDEIVKLAEQADGLAVIAAGSSDFAASARFSEARALLNQALESFKAGDTGVAAQLAREGAEKLDTGARIFAPNAAENGLNAFIAHVDEVRLSSVAEVPVAPVMPAGGSLTGAGRDLSTGSRVSGLNVVAEPEGLGSGGVRAAADVSTTPSPNALIDDSIGTPSLGEGVTNNPTLNRLLGYRGPKGETLHLVEEGWNLALNKDLPFTYPDSRAFPRAQRPEYTRNLDDLIKTVVDDVNGPIISDTFASHAERSIWRYQILEPLDPEAAMLLQRNFLRTNRFSSIRSAMETVIGGSERYGVNSAFVQNLKNAVAKIEDLQAGYEQLPLAQKVERARAIRSIAKEAFIDEVAPYLKNAPLTNTGEGSLIPTTVPSETAQKSLVGRVMETARTSVLAAFLLTNGDVLARPFTMLDDALGVPMVSRVVDDVFGINPAAAADGNPADIGVMKSAIGKLKGQGTLDELSLIRNDPERLAIVMSTVYDELESAGRLAPQFKSKKEFFAFANAMITREIEVPSLASFGINGSGLGQLTGTGIRGVWGTDLPYAMSIIRRNDSVNLVTSLTLLNKEVLENGTLYLGARGYNGNPVLRNAYGKQVVELTVMYENALDTVFVTPDAAIEETLGAARRYAPKTAEAGEWAEVIRAQARILGGTDMEPILVAGRSANTPMGPILASLAPPQPIEIVPVSAVGGGKVVVGNTPAVTPGVTAVVARTESGVNTGVRASASTPTLAALIEEGTEALRTLTGLPRALVDEVPARAPTPVESSGSLVALRPRTPRVEGLPESIAARADETGEGALLGVPDELSSGTVNGGAASFKNLLDRADGIVFSGTVDDGIGAGASLDDVSSAGVESIARRFAPKPPSTLAAERPSLFSRFFGDRGAESVSAVDVDAAIRGLGPRGTTGIIDEPIGSASVGVSENVIGDVAVIGDELGELPAFLRGGDLPPNVQGVLDSLTPDAVEIEAIPASTGRALAVLGSAPEEIVLSSRWLDAEARLLKAQTGTVGEGVIALPDLGVVDEVVDLARFIEDPIGAGALLPEPRVTTARPTVGTSFDDTVRDMTERAGRAAAADLAGTLNARADALMKEAAAARAYVTSIDSYGMTPRARIFESASASYDVAAREMREAAIRLDETLALSLDDAVELGRDAERAALRGREAAIEAYRLAQIGRFADDAVVLRELGITPTIAADVAPLSSAFRSLEAVPTSHAVLAGVPGGPTSGALSDGVARMAESIGGAGQSLRQWVTRTLQDSAVSLDSMTRSALAYRNIFDNLLERGAASSERGFANIDNILRRMNETVSESMDVRVVRDARTDLSYARSLARVRESAHRLEALTDLGRSAELIRAADRYADAVRSFDESIAALDRAEQVTTSAARRGYVEGAVWNGTQARAAIQDAERILAQTDTAATTWRDRIKRLYPLAAVLLLDDDTTQNPGGISPEFSETHIDSCEGGTCVLTDISTGEKFLVSGVDFSDVVRSGIVCNETGCQLYIEREGKGAEALSLESGRDGALFPKSEESFGGSGEEDTTVLGVAAVTESDTGDALADDGVAGEEGDATRSDDTGGERTDIIPEGTGDDSTGGVADAKDDGGGDGASDATASGSGDATGGTTPGVGGGGASSGGGEGLSGLLNNLLSMLSGKQQSASGGSENPEVLPPAAPTKPRLSCADVIALVKPHGESVGEGKTTVSWGCYGEATAARGIGFKLGATESNSGAASGSFVVPVKDTGQQKLTLGIECVRGGTVLGKRTCDIPVVRPSATVVVAPSAVARGATARISWSSVETLGSADACRLYGPESALLDTGKATGEAFTPPLRRNTEFALQCDTKGGGVLLHKFIISVLDDTGDAVKVIIPARTQASVMSTENTSAEEFLGSNTGSQTTGSGGFTGTSGGTTVELCNPEDGIYIFTQCILNSSI